MEEGQADLFLTYCTNARSTAGQVAGLQVIALPEGQEILARPGFAAPTRPAP